MADFEGIGWYGGSVVDNVLNIPASISVTLSMIFLEEFSCRY